MKEKTKRTNSNKPICSKNNNKHVGAGLVPAHNKGITLIALILTIIVLLILAVVAINAVKGDGIISHAKNARKDYTDAQKNEQKILLDYEAMLDPWKQEQTKVMKGDIILNVGDTITNFKAGGKTWKVLGAENGKLLLRGSKLNDLITLDGNKAGWSETEQRFVAAEEALNTACKDGIKLTAEEETQVSEIRSIKIEDIYRVINFDSKYRKEITYSIVKNENGTTVKEESEGESYQFNPEDPIIFKAPNTLEKITEPYTVRANFDRESLESCCLIFRNSGNNVAYNMLFCTDPNDVEDTVLFASSAIDGENAYCFGLINMFETTIYVGTLWRCLGGTDDSFTFANTLSGTVYPVVSLASNIKLTPTGNSGEWNITE